MIRRAPLLILVASLTVLVWAPLSLASRPSAPHTAPLSAAAGTLPAPSQAALTAEAVSGPCTVDGTVLSIGGAPVADAAVYVFFEQAGKIVIAAWVQTGNDGTFSVAGVPETTAGEIDVYLPNGNSFWAGKLTYTEAGPNHFVLRPGTLNVALSARPDSSWRPPLLVHTYGSGGGATTHVPALSGKALAATPNLTYAVAYIYTNRAIEWFASTPRTIAAGASGGSLTFRLSNARAAWLSTPRWASGRPGASVGIALNNWPKGAKIGFSGTPVAPSATTTTWSATTANGKETITRSVKIPKSATPGYSYTVVVRHLRSGSHLELPLTFQVASLTSSRATLTRGQSLRLSGVVPTQGHWGATTPGKKKLVTVYRRTTSAGQPPHWDARRDGWTTVGTYRTDGYGEFVTGYLRPASTTWYVASYAGDNEYHPAFTSVLKVSVH